MKLCWYTDSIDNEVRIPSVTTYQSPLTEYSSSSTTSPDTLTHYSSAPAARKCINTSIRPRTNKTAAMDSNSSLFSERSVHRYPLQTYKLIRLPQYVKNQLERKPDRFTPFWKWRQVEAGKNCNGLEEGENGPREMRKLQLAKRKSLIHALCCLLDAC